MTRDQLACGHDAYLYAVSTAEGTYCWQCQHDMEATKPLPTRVHNGLFLWYAEFRSKQREQPDLDTFYEESKRVIDECFSQSLP